MNTPDFTPAGVTAIVLGVLTNIYVLFGLNVTDTQKGAIAGLVTTGVLVAFLIGDAIVRHGRASNAPAIVASKKEAATLK